MDATRKHVVKQLLLENIRDLERIVTNTKTTLDNKSGFDFAVERLDGLLTAVDKIKSYIPELNQHLDNDDLEELIRVTNLINELSFMIKNDARDLLTEIKTGISRPEVTVH